MSTSARRKRRVHETHQLNESRHSNSKSLSIKREKKVRPFASTHPQSIPLWAPDGADLKVVPPEIRQAIAQLIQPIYEQFVLNASDGLEKSLGITITHLLWLEILEQLDIKREYVQIEAVLHITHNRPEMIDRHLHLLDSKLRFGYFLVRIKELQQRLAAVKTQLPPPLNIDNPILIPTNLAPIQSPSPEIPSPQP
jgi:hypothetical protein